MEARTFDDKYRNKLDKLSTTNISDAMDKIGLRGAVIGIRPMYKSPKIIGRAVTIKVTAVGTNRPKYHGAVRAIDAASPGDVIIVDNRGDMNNNGWGEIVSMAAKMKGVSGVVVDGVVRDIDACEEIGFPVYARGVTPLTARGRVMEESFNEPVRIVDIYVRPGDIVIADGSGVVIIPIERIEDVLKAAEEIYEKEQAMLDELRRGVPVLEVDQKYSYDTMLNK